MKFPSLDVWNKNLNEIQIPSRQKKGTARELFSFSPQNQGGVSDEMAFVYQSVHYETRK